MRTWRSISIVISVLWRSKVESCKQVLNSFDGRDFIPLLLRCKACIMVTNVEYNARKVSIFGTYQIHFTLSMWWIFIYMCIVKYNVIYKYLLNIPDTCKIISYLESTFAFPYHWYKFVDLNFSKVNLYEQARV